MAQAVIGNEQGIFGSPFIDSEFKEDPSSSVTQEQKGYPRSNHSPYPAARGRFIANRQSEMESGAISIDWLLELFHTELDLSDQIKLIAHSLIEGFSKTENKRPLK